MPAAFLIAIGSLSTDAYSQPQKMSYQAVVRNASNALIVSTQIGMKISVLQGTASGTLIYAETQTPTTNGNGLATVEIGSGNAVTGTFASIDWSTGVYFIKTETDPAGGTNYSITGISQLLSVPYALFAKSAENGVKLSGNNAGDMLYWNGTAWINVTAGTSGQILSMSSGNAPVWQNSSLFFNPIAPAATVSEATSVLMNSATLNGSVNANNYSTTVDFKYGLTTDYGSTSTATQSPVTGSTGTTVSKSVSSLLANTTYHFRVQASNAVGVTNSSDMTFLTSGAAPTASTVEASNTSTTGATLNGTVNANGFSSTVTFEYGLTTGYGTTETAYQSPVTGNSNISVSVNLSGLASGTTYHFRLKAVNSIGTSNGTDMTFSTFGEVPAATTNAAVSIVSDGSTLNGTVNPHYLSTSVSFEYGLTTDYGSTATAAQSPVTGIYGTSVSAAITGLSAAATYHYRVKATNSLGSTYGSDLTFTTLGELPAATTNTAISIAVDGSTLKGDVNANYLSTTVSFEYGLTNAYGNTATAAQSPVTGNSNTSVSAILSGLSGGTAYHYRVKAINSLGTTNGSDMTFTTLGAAPEATTAAITAITTTGVTLAGTVNANLLTTSVSFNYGLTTDYGSNVTATPGTVTGNSSTSVSASVTGLSVGTTYHYRVSGINSVSTTNGSDMTFKTAPATVNDTEGNVYNVVAIGAQVWMAENLKTTKYSNGLVIGTTSPATLNVSGESTPKYQWAFNGNESNVTTYGRLYTWFAVNDNRNVCPTGWHVPSDAEWTILTTFMGGESVAGGKLKETGTTHWTTPNSEATNVNGFTALPGGFKDSNGGNFFGFGTNGYWWCSTESSTTDALYRTIGYDAFNTGRYGGSKFYGYSIRCLQD
jgi:uncharacterized protein (TIGR02145 family)